MPRPAGQSWRAVDGLAFVADIESAQAPRAAVLSIQVNNSGRCLGARAFARA
jgi:hypothetical protein